MTSTGSLIEKLFEQHFKTAVFLSYRIVGSYEVAEDIVQEIFIKLLDVETEHIKEPAAYLFRATRNASIDHIRREPLGFHRSIDTVELQIPPSAKEQERELEYAKDIAALSNGIDRLPPQSQRVLKLICYSGYTYQEVADKLGLSLSTIKTHMYRSYKFLKEYMGDKNGNLK